MMMRCRIILEPQPEGGYTVFFPEFPDVLTEGDTREEAIKNAKDAIEGYIKVMKEMGWPLPRIEEEWIEVSL